MNYPGGVSTYDIDKAYGECCQHCGEPLYYESRDGHYCARCADYADYCVACGCQLIDGEADVCFDCEKKMEADHESD